MSAKKIIVEVGNLPASLQGIEAYATYYIWYSTDIKLPDGAYKSGRTKVLSSLTGQALKTYMKSATLRLLAEDGVGGDSITMSGWDVFAGRPEIVLSAETGIDIDAVKESSQFRSWFAALEGEKSIVKSLHFKFPGGSGELTPLSGTELEIFDE